MVMNEVKLFGMDPAKYRPREIPVYGVALVYRMLDSAVSKYLHKFHLSAIKFNVLAVIEFQSPPEGISQVHISKKLIVTASNIARLLERMQAEGLIERYPHKADRRIKIVRNTAKAKRIINQVWTGYQKVITGLAAKLPGNEQKRLSRILAAWFVSLRDQSPVSPNAR